MSQQDTITLHGYVGSDPQMFGKNQNVQGCTLRIGCNRRYYQQEQQEWKSQPTTWVTVKAFRDLAHHICASVHKGDPVIVTGRLAMESWQHEGNNRHQLIVEATSLGHNLSHGVSSFAKISSQEKDPRSTERCTEEEIHQELTQGSYKQCEEFLDEECLAAM